MKLKYKDFLIYLVSISLLISLFYYSFIYLTKKPLEIINFIKSDINEVFEIEITNNLDDINNFLKEYTFIESYLLKRKKNEVNIQINLKKPFAINNITNELIFYDNTNVPTSYFKRSYLETIKLIDISENSIRINNYLSEYFEALSFIFDIDQIEYIDDRRYNLVLSNGRIVMLPKVIDSKLLYFLKNNIDLIDKNTSYNKFLDLRNFHNKTIRLK